MSCQSRKRIYFIYFEQRYELFFEIIKSLEDLGVLIDGVTETVQSLVSLVAKGINGSGVRRVGRGYMDKDF